MIDLHIENRIATLTLNRPEKRNALDDAVAHLLHQHLLELATNDACKVLIIEGAGEAFCAGADLAYLQQLQQNDYEDNLKDSTALMAMFRTLYAFPKLTIAKVHGPAFAGGCGLASICDFCFASENAQFAYTEVKIGFIPAIVSVFLTPKIGENNAKRLLLTGDVVSSAQALQMGLITEVISASDLNEYTTNFAQKLVKQTSMEAIAATKQLLNNLPGHSLNDQLSMAAAANAKARSSEDCKKGIQSFLNKEKLTW